jgi:hypothetical protein
MIWKYGLAFVSDRREWLLGQDGHDSLLNFITCVYLLVGRSEVIWAGAVRLAGTMESSDSERKPTISPSSVFVFMLTQFAWSNRRV